MKKTRTVFSVNTSLILKEVTGGQWGIGSKFPLSAVILVHGSLHDRRFIILGDPGADSGDEEKSKRAEKCMVRRKVMNGEKSPWGQCLTRPVPVRHCPQGLFSPFITFLRTIYFSARLDFSSSPLSAPGSPRMALYEPSGDRVRPAWLIKCLSCRLGSWLISW